MNCKYLFFLLLFLFTACYSPVKKNVTKNGLESTISNQLSKKLNLNTKIIIEHKKIYNDWTYLCGKPINLDGSSIDYTKTSLSNRFSKGLIDDYFCALVLNTSNNLSLKELVVGDTDSPMFDWIEKYHLPDDILD